MGYIITSTHNAALKNPLQNHCATYDQQHNIHGIQSNDTHARTVTVALYTSKAFDTVNLQETFYTHPKHHYQIDSKLHKSTQSIYTIRRTQINTTPIQDWHPSRRRTLTHILQHIHIRHTATTSTTATHFIRR